MEDSYFFHFLLSASAAHLQPGWGCLVPHSRGSLPVCPLCDGSSAGKMAGNLFITSSDSGVFVLTWHNFLFGTSTDGYYVRRPVASGSSHKKPGMQALLCCLATGRSFVAWKSGLPTGWGWDPWYWGLAIQHIEMLQEQRGTW